jgi:hypothetical protein
VASSDPLTSTSARTQLRAITQETGGVLFQVERAEVDEVVPTLMAMDAPDAVTLLSRRFALAGAKNLELPVDETLETLTVMVSMTHAGTLPNVGITRPDGTAVVAGDTDLRLMSLGSVVAYTLSEPQDGTWRIALNGTGSYAVRVYGNSNLALNQLRMIDLNAPTPSPDVDFVLLDGQPVAGDPVTADLRFTQSPLVDRVKLLAWDGRLIADIVPETADSRYFRIRFTAPSESFIVHATGLSPGGKPFVREISVPVSPQPVGVTVSPGESEVEAGKPARLEATIRNASAIAATYRLSLVSELGWAAQLPADVTVPEGASVTVPVSVTPTAGTPEGTRQSVMILVEDVANPGTRNTDYATVKVLTQAPGAPTITSVTGGNRQISVAFVAGGGGAAVTYTATCTSSTGGASGSVTGGLSPLIVTGLTNGTSYACTVTAVNSSGSSSPSSASGVVYLAIEEPVSVPTLSEWGLIVLMMSLLASVFLDIRNRSA